MEVGQKSGKTAEKCNKFFFYAIFAVFILQNHGYEHCFYFFFREWFCRFTGCVGFYATFSEKCPKFFEECATFSEKCLMFFEECTTFKERFFTARI